MVLPKDTLTDTLIEGGLNPDAAERAAEMIALGYDEVAKQGEVDRRLDEQDRLVDRRFDEQDRLSAANFRTSDAKIEAVGTRVKDLRAELLGRIQGLKDEMDAKFAAVDKQFAAVNQQFAAVNQRIDDLKNSTDRQFRVLMWMIGLGVAAFIGLAAAVITLLLDILSRLP